MAKRKGGERKKKEVGNFRKGASKMDAKNVLGPRSANCNERGREAKKTSNVEGRKGKKNGGVGMDVILIKKGPGLRKGNGKKAEMRSRGVEKSQ